MNDQFIMQIMAALDTKGVKADYNKIKQMFEKDPTKINAVMDMSATKTEINKFIKEYAPQLQKMFSDIGVKVDLKDLESSMKSVFIESEKAVKNLANAEKQAYEMNKSFDKQRLAEKNKMHLDELQAYKENANYDKKAIADKKSLFLAEEQGYKINSSLRQKEIAEQKKLYLDTEQAYKTNNNMDARLASERNKLKIATLEAYKTNDKLNDSMAITKNRANGASQSFQSYLKSLKPQALKSYSSEIKDLSDSFTKASESGKQIDLSKANSHLSKFKSEMKNAGMETASLTTIIKQNISAFTNWYFIGNAVSTMVRNFTSAIKTITEVDTLLTEISKTSEISAENLKKLGIEAYDFASKYGESIQGYLTAFQEMSRAGYDENQAKALAELSILAQSAGDMTAELSNEYIVATNAAYKLEGNVSKLNDILDAQNQVSNRNAISMEKIAEATKVAGSMASNSNVQVNELTAAISTMGVVTQDSGETLGRAFKGILQNLQSVKGETEDGEIIDAESLSKVEIAADALGVKLKEVRDGVLSLRDPMQILKELSSAYSGLSDGDVRGANLVNALGGKYRSNQLVALLDNYEMYEKILSDYEGASGSAAAEAQKTADSIEGRLNKLTNTWNRTVAGVADSDILKSFISMGTGAIDLVDQLELLQTALIALSIVGTYKAGSGLISWLTNATSSAISFGNALNIVKSNDFIANTDNLSKAIQGLSLTQATAVLSTKSLDAATIQATMTQAGFSIEEAKSTASTLTMASAQSVATGTTIGLGASFKALTTAMMANPVGLVLTALTVGISALSFGINKYNKSKEEALQVSKELTTTYKQEQESLDSQINSYKELQKQLEKGNISTEETSSIKEQLLSIQSNLTSAYGIEAEQLDLLNGKYETQIGLLSELSKKKAEEYIAENKVGFDNANKYLTEKDAYKLTGSSGINLSDELQDYIKSYSESLFARTMGDKNGEVFLRGNTELILYDMSVEEAYATLTQLYNDIDEKFGDGTDAEKLKTSISNILNSDFDKSKIEDAKATVASYVEAQVLANDKLFGLYQQSIGAVENYNKAIASGDITQIESTKKALDEVKESVYSQTDAVEGSKNVFDDLFNSIASSANTVSDVSKSAASLFDISTYEKQIDGLQSSLSSLQSAQEKLEKGNLSSSEVLDLLQEFPQLTPYVDMAAKGFGNLSKGLTEVAKIRTDGLVNDLTSIRDTLSDTDKIALDTAVNALKQMGQEATITSSEVLSLSDAISALSKHNDLSEKVNEDIKELGYISTETLGKLSSAYSEMDGVLTSYLAGMASTEDVLASLKVAYDKDVSNYNKAIMEKKKDDSKFYKSIVDNLSDDIKEKNKQYGIDLQNYESLSKAKLEIEKELARKIAALKSSTNKYESSLKDADSGRILNPSIDAFDEVESAQKELEAFQKVIDETNLAINSALDFKEYSGSDNSDKDKNKSSKVFDWISIAATKASEKAKAIIDSITKYSSFTSKNKRIDLAINAKVDEKASLETIRKSYESLASKVGLSKEYQKLVDSGALKVETITDEKLANKIDEYTKWRDAAKSVGDQISDISDEIKELNQQKLDNIKSYFDMKNSQTDSKISVRESEIALNEAKGRGATKSDYNYLISRERDNIKNAENEAKNYTKTLESLLSLGSANGGIDTKSPEHYAALQYLDDLSISANEARISIIDLSNEKIKLDFVQFDNAMEQANKAISEIDQSANFVDDNSIEQILLFQSGYEKASENVRLLNAEITKLNKQYKNNKEDVIYKERLDDLASQLSTNANAIKSYEDSIISAMKSRYDEQLDLQKDVLDKELKNIETARKKRIDALNEELDKYKKIIDERKKALRDEQDTDNYNDEVSQYTKDISKLESRISTLKQAELDGDTVARKERIEAEEELATKQKDLAKLQKDRSVDLAEDALDEEYDAYEEMKNKQISDTEAFFNLQTEKAQSIYDSKVAQMETLYENERQLIIDAANLTQSEFSKAFESINSTLSKYGLSMSSELNGALTSGSASATSKPTSSSVYSILGSKSDSNKKQDTSNLSDLNKYLASKGYKVLTKDKVVALAKALGLSDINSVDLVGNDKVGLANKERVRKAISSMIGFSGGGMVKEINKTIAMNGDEALTSVRRKEIILDQTDSQTFKDFVPTMNNFMNHMNTVPIPLQALSAKQSQPMVTINLPANTTITKDAMSEYRKFIPEITQAVSKEIMSGVGRK